MAITLVFYKYKLAHASVKQALYVVTVMIIEIMYPHYLFSGLEFVLANKYGIFIICQLVAWLKNLRSRPPSW